jgi:hypothetical protein
VSRSLRKASSVSAVDPDGGVSVSLFNPRVETWVEHFRWRGEEIIGSTATGRATVSKLALNQPLMLAIRREEKVRGRHPPH